MLARRRGVMAWTVRIIVLLAIAGCTRQAQHPTATSRLKVGLVYDVGGRGDLSFNDMAYAGLSRSQKDFGDRVEMRDLKPHASGEDWEELLRQLAGEGFDLVIGIGGRLTDGMLRVATEFPDVKFGLVDGFVRDVRSGGNIIFLLFKEHEGSFLVGAAAALKSKTGIIGFVGGTQSLSIEKFEIGYIAGAKYVKPRIQVLIDYAGSTGEALHDPVKGKDLALAQYDRGADVIYHASGRTGIGVLEAAVIKRKLAIGVDTDQSLTARQDQRSQILTSMVKRVDVAVYETIRAMVNGQYKAGAREFGLNEDGVGYAMNEYNRNMMADIAPRLEALKKDIIAGKIAVPSDRRQLDELLKKIEKR